MFKKALRHWKTIRSRGLAPCAATITVVGKRRLFTLPHPPNHSMSYLFLQSLLCHLVSLHQQNGLYESTPHGRVELADSGHLVLAHGQDFRVDRIFANAREPTRGN